MTDNERIEAVQITPEQAKATSQAILSMYEDGDRRGQLVARYRVKAREAGYGSQLDNTVTYRAVLDMFYGVPADELDGLMELSPDDIASRYASARREEFAHG